MSNFGGKGRFGHRTYTYTLAAGEAVEVNGEANEVRCISATAAFKLRIDRGPSADFEAGIGYRAPGPFSSVTIENPNASAITVKLSISRGGVSDSRLSLPDGARVADDAPDMWDDFAAVSVGAGANAQLLAANTDRREAILSNNGAASVYVLGSTGTTPRGVVLAAGATFVIQTTAEIRCYNPGGAAVDILASETVQ